jgi:hypothetical protein
VDVLDVFGGAGDVGEVTAGAVLAALGLAGGAAGVHQERGAPPAFMHRLDPGAVIVVQNLVDKEVPAVDHRRGSGIFAGVALPYQHLVDRLAVFGGMLDGHIGILLVVQQGAAAIIGIHGDQHGCPSRRCGRRRRCR